ncbi:MAG: T9SS type A sorting domain-containing protein [Chitinophagaceae bacterium]|nr:T9SS type A sorting domain-containing protein [Chitinophagaceae bacterium]
MISRITVFLLLQMSCNIIVNAQQGFYKVFPEQDYHSIGDMIAINDNHFAFITSAFFYRIDGNGKILVQKELKQGISTYLESVVHDQEGNFWIAAMVFETINDSKKVLYKLSPTGQILKTIDFGISGSFDQMKLAVAGNNSFYLAYKERGKTGNAAIQLMLLEKGGNIIWTKQATDTIYNLYNIKAGSNNTVDICYQLKDDRKGQVATVDVTGKISKRDINLTDPVDSDYYTNDFIRTTDGFVFCGLVNKPRPFLTDGLVYKTDDKGDVLWEKTFDIKQSDNFHKIEAVADGYIILSTSGYENLASNTEGDVVLIKVDKQGNKVWTRAFGGAKTDYGKQLRILDQHIIFAGQSSYPSVSTSIPFVCKTNLQGEVPGFLPFEPAPASSMKTIETPVQQYALTMTQSAAGPNASLISGGNVRNTEDDQTYPFATRVDKTGKNIWYKQLSDYPAQLTVLKQVRPNEYIAITEINDIFANTYDVYKLDETGKIIWKKQIGGNAIRDVIATRDGGILIAGTLDISFVNFETLIIKLDAAGNEQWFKTIGDLRIWETGRKIVETPEQDFLIVGNAQTEFDPASKVYMLKIDRQGNKLWAKTFTDETGIDIGYDVIMTPEQGYLITGISNKYPLTNKDLLLIKTDKNGNQTWRKKHDLHMMDEGLQIINSSGGGFLILGTTAEPQAGPLEKYIYVMKTDAEGRNEGVRYYGKNGVQTMNPSMTVLSTGDTIITGTTQNGYGQETLFMTTLKDFIPAPATENPSITLYPNPSSGSSSLVFNSSQTGEVTIGIFDQSGRLLRLINRTKTGVLLFKEDLDMSSLPTGTYVVSVWFNGKRDNIKWLIVR